MSACPPPIPYDVGAISLDFLWSRLRKCIFFSVFNETAVIELFSFSKKFIALLSIDTKDVQVPTNRTAGPSLWIFLFPPFID